MENERRYMNQSDLFAHFFPFFFQFADSFPIERFSFEDGFEYLKAKQPEGSSFADKNCYDIRPLD